MVCTGEGRHVSLWGGHRWCEQGGETCKSVFAFSVGPLVVSTGGGATGGGATGGGATGGWVGGRCGVSNTHSNIYTPTPRAEGACPYFITSLCALQLWMLVLTLWSWAGPL